MIFFIRKTKTSINLAGTVLLCAGLLLNLYIHFEWSSLVQDLPCYFWQNKQIYYSLCVSSASFITVIALRIWIWNKKSKLEFFIVNHSKIAYLSKHHFVKILVDFGFPLRQQEKQSEVAPSPKVTLMGTFWVVLLYHPFKPLS